MSRQLWLSFAIWIIWKVLWSSILPKTILLLKLIEIVMKIKTVSGSFAIRYMTVLSSNFRFFYQWWSICIWKLTLNKELQFSIYYFFQFGCFKNLLSLRINYGRSWGIVLPRGNKLSHFLQLPWFVRVKKFLSFYNSIEIIGDLWKLAWKDIKAQI